jgi:hypothetical protein
VLKRLKVKQQGLSGGSARLGRREEVVELAGRMKRSRLEFWLFWIVESVVLTVALNAAWHVWRP